MPGTTNRVYQFGPFRLDPLERLLIRDGSPIQLTPKLFDTLLLLVENSGHLLSKDELMKKLWPDSFVEEVNLSQNVSRLRKILEQTPSQTFIATIPGQGYRFVADVQEISDGRDRNDALIIQSHTRESIVVEEEEDDDEKADSLTFVPAVQGRRSFWRASWLIPVAIAAAALAWLAQPPKPPRLLAAVQITNDGRSKWQGYEGPVLLTDGSRIYVVEDAEKGRTLAQVSVSGGETVPIAAPLPDPQIVDFDRRSSEMLMLAWSGGADLNAPLWAYSVLTGSYRRLGDLTVSDATWAADGSILFTRGQELWSAKPDGSEEQLLARLPGLPGAPRESPDRRVIRFTMVDRVTQTTSLWEVSRDGENPHALLPGWNTPPRECCGSWTPDGRYYVFQSLRDGKWGIWALREHGNFVRKFRGPFRLTTGPIDYVAPATSLDGKQLFTVGLQPRNELLCFDRAKNRFVPFLTELRAASLSFSRDGKWVAYISDLDGQLWRAKADGTNRQQLTFPPAIAAQPSWSPDGKRIAFIRGLKGKNWKVYVISVDGGPATELLSESVNEFDPTWSPDGTKLAFGRPVWGTESAGSQPAIFTVELEAKEVSKIPGSDGLFSPRWSNAGQLAALSSDSKRLLLYDAAKRTWSDLLSDGVAFPMWSHDDKYIYFQRAGSICRIGVHSGKVERIASLENIRLGGIWGYGSELTPDDTPLLVRDAGSEEVYAFETELP